jgi:glycosyltransferase involved in cell wall biosynthesis
VTVMMKPLVSILIPAFNAQEWIADAIQSAIAQTWPQKEIIIVDDGSRDQTLSVARQFASKDVSVTTQENQGAAAARNRAFSLCHGDYIQWLDADDMLSPDKVTRQMEALDRCRGKRTLLSSEWAYFMYRPRKAKFIHTPLWEDLSPLEWLTRKMEQNLHMQTATWLVSRELAEAAGPWDTGLLGDDDGEYFARVLLASDGVRFISGSKVFYRLSGPGSLSYIGQSDRKMEAQFRSMELNIKYLRSLDDSQRVRAACLKYLQEWLINFYPERRDLVDKCQQLAAVLGGRLEPPQMSWKYAWIEKLLGMTAAKRTQFGYNRLKASLIGSWDESMLRFGK